MFILRSVKLEDLDDLYELSQLYLFINLPADKDLITKKIQSSIKSFKQADKDLSKDHYVFVLEDLTRNKVIGCSMIHAQHGTQEEPHFYLKVSQENKFSSTINTGFIHGTLKLGHDCDGPSEIGGLILHPNYRKNEFKLGKQLSFIRFLYMGLNPERFKTEIHSELMPPFDKDGRSPLWEAIGRRFMNMEYHDADVLSRTNKEFILSLFPSDTIYETLLPVEARNAIGKVGEDTQPVKRMLEKIGFKYSNEVDPFDGGPHYRSPLKEIQPVKDIFEAELDMSKDYDPENFQHFLLNLGDKNNFKAARVSATRDGNKLYIKSQELKELKITKNIKVKSTSIGG
jgi:arginine N-succinyltransferase